jgi:two-component system KDP operon response regulator KdpE
MTEQIERLMSQAGNLGSLGAVAQRHAKPAPDMAAFQNSHLEVDLVTRLVKVRGKLVKLTTTEYALLQLFVRHAGRVLTHRQILNKVWEPAYVGQTHCLRVYMTHLREKIEENPSQPELFITEPGIGYRLKSKA